MIISKYHACILDHDKIFVLNINNRPMGELGLAWGGREGTFFDNFPMFALRALGPWAHGPRPLGPLGPIFNSSLDPYSIISNYV